MAIKQRAIRKSLIRIGEYALLLAAALLLLSLLWLWPTYGGLKKAVSAGWAGKNQLSQAVSSLRAGNWVEAIKISQKAENSFSAGLADLASVSGHFIFRRRGPARNQLNDLKYLLATGETLSRAFNRGLPLARDLATVLATAPGGDFNNLNADQKSQFLKKVYEAEPELNGLKADLNLSLLNLKKIRRLSLFWPIYGQISALKDQLALGDHLLAALAPLSRLLPALGGYPQPARFLLLLENNDELRPTGGFIGTYGILATDNGNIISLETEDSYHLDMPAVGKWNLDPPEPIKKYLKVENWYLRDANWSPDWPTAARQVLAIYNGENAATGGATQIFNGVIAITPDFVSDLLALVGPLTISGQTYNVDNFQELLQYTVEVGYKKENISSWNRKEIINEILTELQKRLFALPAANWKQLLNITTKNIAAKNIQLYLTRSDLEREVITLGAGGQIALRSGDYLGVVDANLAAFKTDAVVKKSLSYAVTGETGKSGVADRPAATAVLTLSYKHQGGFDWRTTRYQSYTRVYAPLGSRLIAISGLDEAPDLSTTDDAALDKTVFGFYFSVGPSQSREITLTYSLPDAIAQRLAAGDYSLFAQKQAGRETAGGLVVTVKNGRKTIINSQGNLLMDEIFTP